MKVDSLLSSRFMARLIAAAMLAAALIPLASWLVWSFGLPVESLFSAEGLRWLALRAVPESFSRHLAVMVFFLSAWGVWRLALAHPTVGPVRRRAMYLCVAVGLVQTGAALLAALWPESPLLSIHGTLLHSPFSVGIGSYAIFCATVLGLIFAAVVGAVRESAQLVRALVDGPRRHAPLLLLAITLQFDWACVRYVLAQR